MSVKKVFLSVLVMCVLLFSIVSIAEAHALAKANYKLKAVGGPKAFGSKTAQKICGASLCSEVKHDEKKSKPSSGVSKQSTNARVIPAITLSPSSGPVGTTVKITGIGFPTSTSIAFGFNGVGITPTTSVTSDAAGGFTGTIKIPESKSGAKIITSAGGGIIAHATFLVK